MSYEKLRLLVNELGATEIGLLLADEGHRLKNAGELVCQTSASLSTTLTRNSVKGNQTYLSITQLNCKRRVILTGTPIQVRDRFSLASYVDD